MSGEPDDAWLGVMQMYSTYRHLRNKHPDLAGFHAQRYRVYCELLGLDLNVAPDRVAFDIPDHWFRRSEGSIASYVHKILTKFADAHARLETPFANYLEAPEPVVDLYNRHSKQLQAPLDQLKQRYLDVMVDCATRLWGRCPHRVSPAELSARGVGREHEPDEWDYL